MVVVEQADVVVELCIVGAVEVDVNVVVSLPVEIVKGVALGFGH